MNRPHALWSVNKTVGTIRPALRERNHEDHPAASRHAACSAAALRADARRPQERRQEHRQRPHLWHGLFASSATARSSRSTRPPSSGWCRSGISASPTTGASRRSRSIHNGVMYVTNAKATVAIDVATGKQIWKQTLDWPPETPRVVCCGVSNKGAAIYNGKVYPRHARRLRDRLRRQDRQGGLEVEGRPNGRTAIR